LVAGLIGSPVGAAAVAPAAAVQAQVTAAPAPVTETEDQRIARLVSEQVAVRVQDLVESGQLGGARKGLTATAPGTAPAAPGGADLNEHGLPATWPEQAAARVHRAGVQPVRLPAAGELRPERPGPARLSAFCLAEHVRLPTHHRP